jgi:CheY-like chemotaxis protein
LSLTGNLEDLPLLDIIQIVSFSKKTGYLAIHVDAQEAAIVFHLGLVVCAYTWESLPFDPRAQSLPHETRERLIRKRIETALELLIRLRDGEFNFSLSESLPSHVAARDIRPETLHAGINPQELLLDLARGMDEDRRDSSAVLEASFAHPDDSFDQDLAGVSTFAQGVSAEPLGEPSSLTQPMRAIDVQAAMAPAADRPPPEPAAMHDLLELPAPMAIPEAPAAVEALPSQQDAVRCLLLVDDESDVRGVLAERFREAGYEVHEADGPEEALKQAARLAKASSAGFLLVTDLGMPASGGASFQGGFEVVKRLWKMNLRPAVLMMTESLSTALRARARQMGITEFVFKPGLSKLDPEQFEADLAAFAERLVRDVLPGLQQPNLAARKAGTKGAPAGPAASAGPDEVSRQLRTLQQNLEELRQRGDAAQISLLVMKVAREFFERGLLLLVKGDELRGLGGFGPAPRGESLNLLARDVQIPLSEPSVFRQVAETRRTWSGELPEGKPGGQLLVKIGRFRSNGAALLPLVTHRQTTAVLFGDNPETGRSLERVELLEVFLDQAGVALEKVFLQRKLQSLEG